MIGFKKKAERTIKNFFLRICFFAIVASVVTVPFIWAYELSQEDICRKEGVVTSIQSIGTESTFIVDNKYDIKAFVTDLSLNQPYCLISTRKHAVREDSVEYANDKLREEFYAHKW